MHQFLIGLGHCIRLLFHWPAIVCATNQRLPPYRPAPLFNGLHKSLLFSVTNQTFPPYGLASISHWSTQGLHNSLQPIRYCCRRGWPPLLIGLHKVTNQRWPSSTQIFSSCLSAELRKASISMNTIQLDDFDGMLKKYLDKPGILPHIT